LISKTTWLTSVVKPLRLLGSLRPPCGTVDGIFFLIMLKPVAVAT
jgi:hypothetical protein